MDCFEIYCLNNIPITFVNLNKSNLTKKGKLKEEKKVALLCSECSVYIERWGGNLNKYTKKGVSPRCRKCAGKVNQKNGHQKQIQTNIEKYGKDFKKVIGKLSQEGQIKKYGVLTIFKAKEAFQKKYNIDNPFKLQEFQEKIRQTNIKKYGAINKKQYDLFYKANITSEKELLNKLTIFLEENPALHCTHVETVRFLNCSPIHLTRLLNKYNRTDLLKPKGVSQQENEIYQFLLSLNIPKEEIIKNTRYDFLKGKELDLYLPKYNLAFEFNGLYWHSEKVQINRKCHFLKREQCEKENIQLIQIFEDEWRDKRPIVESIIKNKLGIISNKIFARKCEIKRPSKAVALFFLQKNHLKSKIEGASFIGLFYNKELVQLIAYKVQKDVLYLARVCTKIDSKVVGGLSKLIKYLIKSNAVSHIKSYTDLRFFSGGSLLKLGFIKKATFLSWEWTDYISRYNRRYCVATKEKTEKERAESLGLIKIYDAGQTLWIKDLCLC